MGPLAKRWECCCTILQFARKLLGFSDCGAVVRTVASQKEGLSRGPGSLCLELARPPNACAGVEFSPGSPKSSVQRDANEGKLGSLKSDASYCVA